MSKMPAVANGHSQNWAGNRSSSYDYQHDMTPHKQDGSPRHRSSNGYMSDQHSEGDEGPSYQLEHLATFAMGRDNGISDPKDGLNRLLQMEKSNGIWTQKMQLRLEKKWVVIIDFETGDVVEKFPMHLINSPMAFMGNDPKELYNNILIFIVKEDTKQKNFSPSEMHIFQISRVSAQEVVEDMKLFMAGKWKGFTHQPHHRNQSVPTPEPLMNGAKQQPPTRFSASPETLPGNPRDSLDETSSTSSEKYEREVMILNHCFDDIERFIARLQSSAAAHKELERRRRSRKSKKKDHGDGMLSMRAKPPPEREFVDVFQKFKLSFNLLAKLKSHIHDPNAPELVHFLFTPLALIVDASRDSNYGPNLASKVVSPLLLKEALDLLANCLTSKESDLWHSLGDPWVIPRDQWKGYVAPYHPTFSDGWSPDYPISEERGVAELTAAAAAIAAQKARREDLLKTQREADFREQEYHRNQFYYGSDISGDRPGPSPVGHSPQMEYRSDISVDSIERSGVPPIMHDSQKNFERQQKLWLEELRSRDAKVVQVVFPRTANNDKELTVFRGEYLEVLDDTRKWWKARNFRGSVAHVPHTIVTAIEEDAALVNPYASQQRTAAYNQDSPGRSSDSGSGDRPKGPPIPPPAPAPADWVKSERQGKKGEFRYF